MAIKLVEKKTVEKDTEEKSFDQTKGIKDALKNSAVKVPLMAFKGKKVAIDGFEPITVVKEGKRGYAMTGAVDGSIVKIMTPESDPGKITGKALYVFQAVVEVDPDGLAHVITILTDGPKPKGLA